MESITINIVRLLAVLFFTSPPVLLSPVSALTQGLANDVEMLRQFVPRQIADADPCRVPEKYPWIRCSSGDTPRVTALNLSNMGLTSLLPDFSRMDALEIIDLSSNRLEQPFPHFFAKFAKLTSLNLAYNNIYGTIPTSVYNKWVNRSLTLTMTISTMDLCVSDQAQCGPGMLLYWKGTGTGPRSTQILCVSCGTIKSSKNWLSVKLGNGIPASLVLLFIIGSVYYCCKKETDAGATTDKTGEESSADML